MTKFDTFTLPGLWLSPSPAQVLLVDAAQADLAPRDRYDRERLWTSAVYQLAARSDARILGWRVSPQSEPGALVITRLQQLTPVDVDALRDEARRILTEISNSVTLTVLTTSLRNDRFFAKLRKLTSVD